jgi:glyoxylase-like metal-dependent hydrolase (beta-lactamase superfamily II)
MIRSLRRLLDFDFNRIFFAHGNPIVTRARERLASLLPS